MTTWALVELTSTDFVGAADIQTGYLDVGYLANGYIRGAVVWVSVDRSDNTWS
jgi:hypothetical protein